MSSRNYAIIPIHTLSGEEYFRGDSQPLPHATATLLYNNKQTVLILFKKKG